MMLDANKCYRRTLVILAPLCLLTGFFDLFVVPRLGWDERTHDFANGFVVGMTTVLLLAVLLLRRRLMDERFVTHSRRATALGGVAGALLAIGLFNYHLIVEHQWHSELLAIAFTIAGIKILALCWSMLRD